MTDKCLAGPRLSHRISDICDKSSRVLDFVDDYENVALVSLEQAVEPLKAIVTDLERQVWVVRQRCEQPADDLTPDESAAIMLYTMECDGYASSLYYLLNSTLRTENRELVKPWLPYLKLLSHALSQLPSVSQTVYRGVKLDLSYSYPATKDFIWWSFSSCTMTINVLEKEEFCGKTGLRTLFAIECTNAKNIRQHSYYPNENEVLLLAGTTFEVIGQYAPSSDIHVIQLKETQPSVFLTALHKKTRGKTLSQDRTPSTEEGEKVMTTSMNAKPYSNPALEQELANGDDCVFLYQKELGDRDMSIIVEHAIEKKSCRLLDLHYNEITSKGARTLSNALSINSTLQWLRLSNNWVSDSGVGSIATALSTGLCNLRTLDLGMNGIANQGLQHLIDMLKVNKTLMELSLHDNLIDNHGVKSLMNVLAHRNRSLRWVSLAGNRLISGTSVKHILYMLKCNRTMKFVSLQNCNLNIVDKARLRRRAKLGNCCQLDV